MADTPSHERTFRTSVVYEDNRTAIEWLEKAFGFEVSLIVTDTSGAIVHCELKFGDGTIMVAQEWSEITKSPRKLGGANTQQIHVHLSDGVDAHCERARRAGAKIIQEPGDQFYGDRTYRCLDYEGHVWSFGQTVKELTFAEMEANAGGQVKLRSHL